MPGRNTPLVTGEYYHIYNRGNEKRDIYLFSSEYRRFIETFYYYQFLGPKPKFSHFTNSKLNLFKPTQENKLVEIICYCLMPNHFHFLLKQLKDGGISNFISLLSNSYTKYFNVKHSRVGALLQGGFKSVLVENDEQLIHVSRYIHINPVVSRLVKKLSSYPWSSYSEYIFGKENFCSTGEILGFFPSREEYRQFIEDQISYGTTLEILKHQNFDKF